MDVYMLGLAIGLGYHCYTDVRYMLLYDNTNIVLAVLALLRAWQLDCLKASWQGAVVLGGIMLIIYYASHGGMGEGDVKLAAVLGLWLGVEQGLLCLLLAFVSGALCGGLLLIWQRQNSERALPFGPYLALGALACYVFGKDMLQWYGQFFY